MKAEYGDVAITTATHRLVLVARPNGVRSIFDNGKAVFLRQGMNGGHVARLAAQVHRYHHFG